MSHKPSQVVVTVTCNAVTGEDDYEMYPGKVIRPESIVATYTSTPGPRGWDFDVLVEVFVQGRGVQKGRPLTKTVYSASWWRNAEGGTMQYAPDWVQAWARQNTPPAALTLGEVS